MELITLGEYKGNKIRVNPADHKFINATDMCKAAGKLWANYWQNESAQEFGRVLESDVGIPISQLVYSNRSGPYHERGTWIHEDIAIQLAQWCSPEYALWVSRQIKQLHRSGSVKKHPEHQEAELMSSGLHSLVSEMRRSNNKFDKTLIECERSNNLFYETLKCLQQRSCKQLEKVVQAELCSDEGGVREATLLNGAKVDLIVPGKWIIEVKHWKEYKSAIGQIKVYDLWNANIDELLRIHLFWKPNDKEPTEIKRKRIEKDCKRLGIKVTWHEWKIRPPTFYQPLINFEF